MTQLEAMDRGIRRAERARKMYEAWAGALVCSLIGYIPTPWESLPSAIRDGWLAVAKKWGKEL